MATRCETVLDGNPCLFSGEHGDHIAKGSDGSMWVDRNKTGTWTPLDGDPRGPAATSSDDAPPPPIRETNRDLR